MFLYFKIYVYLGLFVAKMHFFVFFCFNILLFQIIVVPLQPKEHSASRNSGLGCPRLERIVSSGNPFFLCIRDYLYAHLLHVFCINIFFYHFICHIRLVFIQYMARYGICYKICNL